MSDGGVSGIHVEPCKELEQEVASVTEEKLEGLAVQLGTPSFVFDTDILKKRAGWIKEMIHPAKLCFAIKANPFLVEALESQADRYEVCSPGEFHICVERKLPMEKIVLSGVNKEYEDVRYAMEQGVIHYTAESRSQLELVSRCGGCDRVYPRQREVPSCDYGRAAVFYWNSEKNHEKDCRGSRVH